MKFKTMILGSAAALVAVSGAQAADLPVAEPVDYVRICDFDGWGTGIQIPGTETCLKIGGYVRTDFTFTSPNVTSASRSEDHINFFARGLLKFDAINDTEYGVLRSYIELDANDGGNFDLGKAYIQFNGFTLGYVGSFFDNTTGAGFFDGPASDSTTRVFAYTFAGGNGFSATLSFEDRDARETASTTATYDGTATVFAYGGKTAPDVVAAISISQGWGSIKASGAIHQLREDTHANGTDYGYAGGLGVKFNIMSGTSVSLQGQYAHGAVSYTGYGDYDAEIDGADIKKSKAWSALAALTHAWSSSVSQDFHVGYGSFDAYSNTNDHTQLRLGTRVNYTAISNLYIGVGAGWNRTDYSTSSGISDYDEFMARLRVQRNF